MTEIRYAQEIPEVSADRGDADVTLAVTEVPIQLFATTLTANRTITLPTADNYNGAWFKIVRTGLGAFTLDVGGLYTIPASAAAWVDVRHDGTSWQVHSVGHVSDVGALEAHEHDHIANLETNSRDEASAIGDYPYGTSVLHTDYNDYGWTFGGRLVSVFTIRYLDDSGASDGPADGGCQLAFDHDSFSTFQRFLYPDDVAWSDWVALGVRVTVAGDSRDGSYAPSNYPNGTSVMQVSMASSGWPAVAEWVITTYRAENQDIGYQVAAAIGSSATYVRTWEYGVAWRPWHRIDIPEAHAASHKGDGSDPIANATTSVSGLHSDTDKTKLDGIESGATADQTAAEILTAIKTVDGAGSLLDADFLDGHDTSYFAASSDTRIPTQDENDALVGTNGTPSTSNKYVTNSDPRNTDTRTPTDSSVTNAKVDAAAAIAESKLNLASDAGAGTASRRTLGTGAQQAAAGNDSRLSDSRTPTAHKTSHEPGGSDAMTVDAAASTGSLRTIGTGALQAAAGNDSRLSNARTPVQATETVVGGGELATQAETDAGTDDARIVTALKLKNTTALDSRYYTETESDARFQPLGTLSLTEVEVDFGSTWKMSGSFTITGSGLTPGRHVLITQANGPYTGKGTLADEAEMDQVSVTGKVTSTTQITCYWTSPTWISGNFKFAYAVG